MASSPKTYHLKLNIGATTDASLKDSINAINNNLLSTGIKANLVSSGIKKAFSFAKDAVMESIETGKVFEKTLDNVQSISKASVFRMQDMHNASLKLGSTTAFSANQSAEALQFMSQAGWTADKSLTALKDVVNLAAAGDINLANAAEITTDNINAFKLEAKDAGRLADALATGANKSSTNVMELAFALRYAAPKAGAMGYTVEDTVKVLGHLADVGIKGQKAGTSLRAILANLSKAENDTSKKGTEASRALKALGVSLFDAQGKAKPLSAVIEELRTGFSKLKSDKEVAYYADVLGGKVASNALIELGKTGKENIEKLNNAFENTKSTAKEMAEIRMDNLSGDMKKLSGYAETLNIKLYEGMLPYLRESAQVLRENLGLAEDKIPTISKGIGEITVGLAKMSKPAMEVFGFIVDNREILSGLMAGNLGGRALANGAALTANTFKKLKDIIKDFKRNGLKDSVSDALSFGKIGLVTGLIATVIGGVIGIRKHLDKVAKDKNIREHFGNIALSLDEINEISRDIVYQGNIEKIHSSFKMFEELDNINAEIERLQEKQHKIGLKIKAGIELTDEDKEELVQNAKDSAAEIQKYFEQNKISVLEFASGLNDENLGKELSESLISGLNKDSEKAEKIGEKWIKYINKAMKDGIISNKELLKMEEFNIELIQMQQKLESARQRSAMDLEIDNALNKDLSKESLEALNASITEKLKDSDTEIDKTLAETIGILQIQKEDGDISEKKYDSLVKELKSDALETKAKNKAYILGRIGSELYKKYEDEFKQHEKYEDKIFFGDVRDFLTEDKKNEGRFFSHLGYNPLSKSSSSVIKDVLGDETFEHLYLDFKNELKMLENNKRKEIQQSESIKELDDLYVALRPLSTTQDEKVKHRIERKLSNPEIIRETYKYAKEKGFNINDALAQRVDKGMTAEQLKEKLEKGGKEAETLWKKVLEATFEKEYIIELDIKPNVKLKTNELLSDINNNYNTPKRITNNKGIMPAKNADGGIYSNPILTYVAEGKSAEAIIPLDNRPRSRRLLEIANEFMGYDNNRGNNHIVFSPVINISGNGDKNSVMQAIRQSYEEFENNMSRYLERNARVCL